MAARAAVAAGVVCVLALPLVEDGRVVGVLEFVGNSPQDPSIVPVMNIVGCTLGQTLTRLHAVERIEASRVDLKATSAVLHNVNTAQEERSAMRAALDTIRTEFGWAYGSVLVVLTTQRRPMVRKSQCRRARSTPVPLTTATSAQSTQLLKTYGV